MALTKVSRGLLSTSIVDNGNATAITIDSSENVGIGTSSPSSRIHIQNDSDTDYTATNFCTAPSATISNTTSGALNYASLLFSTEANGEFAIGAVQNSGNTASDFVFASRTSGTRTERMRIDSSGNVGIGNSSGVGKLEIFQNNNSGVPAIYARQDGTAPIQSWHVAAGAEKMRIDSSGNLLVGATSAPTARKFYVESQTYPCQLRMGTSVINYPVLQLRSGYVTGGQTGTQIDFRDGTDNSVGTITSTVSATAYNTSSDQRLKENIADADDAGSKVDAIQVRKFDWIADGSHQDYGMVAQELVTVAPEAVSAPEDPEEMMGVDYSKLVPMLVKEIQSLRARVQQLENN